MQVSREDAGGDAIMILSTDRPTDDATIEKLRTIAGVKTVRVLSL
jgi:D-3-phosphoglycerate dehydrogenase